MIKQYQFYSDETEWFAVAASFTHKLHECFILNVLFVRFLLFISYFNRFARKIIIRRTI